MRCRMIRPLSPRLLLVLATVLFAPVAFAGTVYQWKDAKGVTHYADAPPPGQKGVKNRELQDAPAAPQQAALTPEEANCATARKNLEQLKSSQPVGLDANGDGKPDAPMTAEERAKQVQRTEWVLANHCKQPAAAP